MPQTIMSPYRQKLVAQGAVIRQVPFNFDDIPNFNSETCPPSFTSDALAMAEPAFGTMIGLLMAIVMVGGGALGVL